jgi:YkoY family integral membrane protein
MPVLLGLVEIFGQKLEVQDLAVVALLVVLEGVLSIDNALVLGLLAKRLPKNEQSKALWYGLVGAFVFRFIAVFLASLLLKWTFVKFLGGAYLVYIAVRHLFFESRESGDDEKVVLDEHGHPRLVDEDTGAALTDEQEEAEIRERLPVYMTPQMRKRLGLASFWPTVFVIEMTDIAFAVDSILAAIAMVGSDEGAKVHPKLWVVIVGGLLGLMLMRFAARIFITMLDRFPRFETSAYLLVIVIGFKLLGDWGLNSDWSFDKQPVIASQLGDWKQSFERFETRRIGWVHGYEDWLKHNWIFGLPGHHHVEQPEPEPAAEAPAVPAAPAADGEHAAPAPDAPPADGGELKQVPHLLDFHDLRRPECLTFWVLMIACFAYGFVPKKRHA